MADSKARIYEIQNGEYFRHKTGDDPERIYERIAISTFHCVGYFQDRNIVPNDEETEREFFGQIRRFSFNRKVEVTRI